MRLTLHLSILLSLLTLAQYGNAEILSARLEIRTTTGLSTFHMGERIALVLDFTSPDGSKFALITAKYDRSGRMNYERFEVNPSTGASDPLATYFRGGSFLGGGLSSPPSLLSSASTTLSLNLNEWVRFDQPGDYTVTVHSSRVLASQKSTSMETEQPVTSNPLKLHIIPANEQWQRETLASALQALTVRTTPYAPESLQRTSAIADIRFIGSAASIPVLASGLSEDGSGRAASFALGLIGLPPSLRDLALSTLRQQIDSPDVAITGWLLTTLVALETDTIRSPAEISAARAAAYQQALRLVIAALPRKAGIAKAATANVLLREHTGDLGLPDQSVVARALASTLTDLPEEDQAILLNWHWGLLRSVILPQILQNIASLPVTDAGSREMSTYQRVELKSAALHRWYQLDPEAAREAAHAQINSSAPSLTAFRLWFLPSETLPSSEAIWAQALLNPDAKSDPEVLAGLMTRFGTGGFTAQVADKVRGSLDAQACAPQAAMVAYIVKFDPDHAGPLLADVLRARSKTGCYRMLFGDVSRYTTGQVLTSVAIDAVNDADPEAAADALRYLSVYGDQRSKQTIYKRYLAWSQEWTDKAIQLQSPNPMTSRPHWKQERLGQVLGEALLRNQGWVTDDALRSEVLQHCVGDQMCHALQQLAMASHSPYAVTVSQSDGQQSVSVGPYEIPSLALLKAKLSQYAPGTSFVFTGRDRPGDDPLFAIQVKAAFEQAGMNLTLRSESGAPI